MTYTQCTSHDAYQVEEMFLVSLPRYTGRQKLAGSRLADPDAPPLAYEAFVGLLLDWVTWWNTRHRPSALNGKTPIEAWQCDATPLTDVPAGQLATFALEDNGRTYTIGTSGVRWRRRDYLAPWMNGRTGTKVSVRHLPHHDDTIEVFDAATGRHLGPAFLASAASREQIRSVQAARATAARRLKTDLADLDYGLLPDESEDHFLGLEQARLVGTDTLLTTRDNIEAVIEAKAMMCVHGPAGSGKTMSVNSALRHLAPDITHRLELRADTARHTPRSLPGAAAAG